MSWVVPALPRVESPPLGLAWAMFQGTWLLAGWTAFKPLSMSFAEPLLAVGVVVVLVAVSRPAADGWGFVVRKLDARWKRRGHRTLVTPWKITIAFGPRRPR